ncbi:hypothetical protein [Yersinia pseudotuberculosis]|uniref:Uncharacterized protein n=4 Tax=Yersinia pseudotuberculosis complex TaxID=1649845 RepID=Q669D5_YERPS|nr:hypothetical protein [Yersinia pseudotuberculosis]AYW92680.1 hypothetical protein EGX47_16165 [Yersinia pseudotuberculosis]AYW96902.1 hypothetical protein EGX39_14505 [Yersinia pseudotuberculosis]AYX17698.1 hypothetical protein EGX44_22660 [Yersinia pseudotuberculosis]MBO1554813.1 hypothetical protein [Yersinia pseudotuberculosis]MBO1563721.1 hypothetical protein [Yersinia pseudotuberculosis]
MITINPLPWLTNQHGATLWGKARPGSIQWTLILNAALKEFPADTILFFHFYFCYHRVIVCVNLFFYKDIFINHYFYFFQTTYLLIPML